MILINFFFCFSLPMQFNFSLNHLIIDKSNILMKKIPIIMVPIQYFPNSYFFLSDLKISNSFSIFLYSKNNKYKRSAIDKIEFTNFLNKAFIFTNEEENIVTTRMDIYVYNNQNITNSKFLNIHFTDGDYGSGGAISATGSYANFTLINDTFQSCSSIFSGGGISVYGVTYLKVINCTFNGCYCGTNEQSLSYYGASICVTYVENFLVKNSFFLNNFCIGKNTKYTLFMSYVSNTNIECCYFYNKDSCLFDFGFDNDKVLFFSFITNNNTFESPNCGVAQIDDAGLGIPLTEKIVFENNCYISSNISYLFEYFGRENFDWIKINNFSICELKSTPTELLTNTPTESFTNYFFFQFNNKNK